MGWSNTEPATALCLCLSEVRNTTVDGEGVTVTTFEPTKRMSTYLLAFVVCDYANISTNQGDTLVT